MIERAFQEARRRLCCSIYRRFWQVNWAEQWQYRANLLMYLLYWLVSPIVYLSVWTTIANSQGSVSGLTANDFVTYYLTLLIVDQLTSEITIHILAYKIQDGTLSGELLRPIHPILTNTLINNLAFKSLIFMRAHPGLAGALPALPARLQRGHPAQSAAAHCPAIILGFAINFLLGATITCLAFWTTRVYSISEFYFALVTALLRAVRAARADAARHPAASPASCPSSSPSTSRSRSSSDRLPPESYLPDLSRSGWSGWQSAYLLFRWVWRAGREALLGGGSLDAQLSS